MHKNSNEGGQRLFLWLIAITLVVIAGVVIYSVTREGSGGVVAGGRSDDHVKGNP